MEHFYGTIGENWFSYQDFYATMVKHVKSGATMVEVGSWKGRSAAFLAVEVINSGKDIKIHCVDTFEGSIEHITPGSPYYCPELVADKNYLVNEFKKNLAPVQDIIHVFHMTSLEAAHLHHPDESVDFVFIDAAHDKKSVIEDIKAWYPKVKKGGVIAGHDYQANFWGVVEAVNLLFDRKDFKVVGDVWIHEKPKS